MRTAHEAMSLASYVPTDRTVQATALDQKYSMVHKPDASVTGFTEIRGRLRS
jgi:hypothetical protein